MICLFCSQEIQKQIPVIVDQLVMSPPWNEDGSGRDTLAFKYCCLNCYNSIMINNSKSAKHASERLMEKGKE